MKRILIVVMGIVVVFLLGVFIYMKTVDKSTSNTTTSTAESAVSSDGNTEENKKPVESTPFTGVISEETKFVTGKFEELVHGEDSNVGYIGYDTSKVMPEDMPKTQEAFQSAEYRKDYYKSLRNVLYNLSPVLDESGAPQKLYTGHTIYSDVNREGQNGSIYYIINGYDVLNLNVFRNIPDDAGYLLRKEDSSERIRLFNTQEELDKATQAWTSGQEILSDPSKEVPNGIILDGCLLDNATWQADENGNIVIPLSTISTDFSDGTFVSTTGVLHIPTFEGCGSPSVEIPSTKAKNYDVELLAFEIDPDAGTWNYSSIPDGGLWKATLPLANNSFNMDVASASQLTGWTFSFDGTMLNIVTEPCNVTNNFMLRQ